ncbi:hypothetical protein [Tenuibacillus multivorans]|uniref:Competence protein ComGG n=1 Tax=Tenuibacillus multivorans TaxID=237069 RepID=A0A1G9ZBU6_9BACI|nr:hypothetical protein [Tenuibacillus multivorans]GEL77339.1 hypothetical protein TMU01_15740 [Tenuibacillus multivorans]SDN18066.1 hypothetical protein SAMN05216498_1601 [Tenuibacillus multivorans]
MRFKEPISITTLLRIHDERGILFPYLLSILILISAFLLLSLDQERYNLQQTKILKEQMTIQNLIQITVHDFNMIKNDLILIEDEQTIEFEYETGHTVVKYQLVNETSIELQIDVYTTQNQTKPFKFLTQIDV